MKIKQVIIKDRSVYLFTEDPEKDVVILKNEYENRDEVSPRFELGYETPQLDTYVFLGEKHKCISLWFDNEDIPDFFVDFTPAP